MSEGGLEHGTREISPDRGIHTIHATPPGAVRRTRLGPRPVPEGAWIMMTGRPHAGPRSVAGRRVAVTPACHVPRKSGRRIPAAASPDQFCAGASSTSASKIDGTWENRVVGGQQVGRRRGAWCLVPLSVSPSRTRARWPGCPASGWTASMVSTSPVQGGELGQPPPDVGPVASLAPAGDAALPAFQAGRCSSWSEQVQATTRKSAPAARARVYHRVLVAARSSARKSRIADWPRSSCR